MGSSGLVSCHHVPRQGVGEEIKQVLAAGRARWEALCRAVALSLSPFAKRCPLALPGGAQALCRVWLEVLREEWWLWEGTGCQAVPNAASSAV